MRIEAARELLDGRQFEALRRTLTAMNAVDVARLLATMPFDQRAAVFRLLPKNFAVLVFEQLDLEEQAGLLEGFTTEGAREVLEAMSPDDRAALLDEVPAMVARRLLQYLSPAKRNSTLALLGYKEGTAGRVMTPEFVDLRRDMTVTQALERIRKLAITRETVYYAYVMDDARTLLGTVSLKDLVIAPPDRKVGEIMTPTPKSVSTDADQEQVAHVLRDYDILAVPVVDHEGRLVGIVTWDDVVDIMVQETTEDIYHSAAVAVGDQRYFATRILSVVRQRVAWLFLLILFNTVTGAIIAGQHELLGELVILAAFIPLLIGTGGNVGAQSSTVVVRGLATGEITSKRAVVIVARELAVGLFLGAALGILVVGLAFLLGRDLRVAIVVGTTMMGIATLAATIGGALPFIFRMVRLDPAMVSAPFTTTVMDISGVALYFLVANLLLRS